METHALAVGTGVAAAHGSLLLRDGGHGASQGVSSDDSCWCCGALVESMVGNAVALSHLDDGGAQTFVQDDRESDRM